MNTNWEKFSNRSNIENGKQPGIYYLALCPGNISGHKFTMRKEIIYIGMTISKKGVLGRLYQFERAINGKKDIHGGGDRVRFKILKNKISPSNFLSDLYISVRLFPLSKNQDIPTDWRRKGECVKHEYVSFASYFETFKQLPEFNDQKRSPKK